MKIRNVKPESIKIPEVRVRGRMDPETEELFRAFWADAGQVAPVVACQVGEDLVLVDGEHRIGEAIRLRQPTIAVAVMDGTMADVVARNIMLDHVRGKHPVSEMVTAIEFLMKVQELDSEEIAAKTGLTRERVENMMLISTLTPQVRAALDEGKIGVGQALELVRVTDPSAQEAYCAQCQLYRWTTATLREFVAEYLATLAGPSVAPPPAAPPRPTLIRCEYCGCEYDHREIANPSTCRGCFGSMMQVVARTRREMAEEIKREEEAQAAQSEGKTPTPPTGGGA